MYALINFRTNASVLIVLYYSFVCISSSCFLLITFASQTEMLYLHSFFSSGECFLSLWEVFCVFFFFFGNVGHIVGVSQGTFSFAFLHTDALYQYVFMHIYLCRSACIYK